ncbi:hypothetical protein Leucomu_13155 [Leucobacter muris]|uniref:Rho termination factor N-terminal domain-containing protein n=1 Tax=Leucobacter muris TaxID=1935379 RepID=A0ABX5QIG9_9MICO|nr:hypothetical protein [Leucobacter muris]QAB18325.1 hypothetical protein Leucomu_10720 [Leucobacter muris]QAB18729.1 hypothetical protein Leucomu_13155 [Leucobacter muris]
MKLKHAQGRIVDVPENLAEGYIALGWEKVSGSVDAADPTEPSKSWKVDALKAYAADHGIDLGSAAKKDDILAAIEAHETSGNGDEVSGSADVSEPTIAEDE